MRIKGRTEKSMYNVLTGVFGQGLSFILSFITRTVFVKTLGEMYLGLNGLYTNIISVLGLAELGVGTAIVIELYRTVAENNDEKTKQYIQFYKKAYNCIGAVILTIGLAITPFLQHLIKDADAVGELINYKLVFLFYLVNVAFSYFSFAYRLSILQANQEEYRSRLLTYVFKIIETVLQIVTLLVFRNIYLYLIIPLALGIVQQTIRGILIGKWYPIVLQKPQGKLSKNELKNTTRNVFSVTLFKISGTVINSTDNILLSSFIGLTITGLYSNYLILTSAIKTILEKVFTAFIASLGNLNVDAKDDLDKKYNIFNVLSFLNFWVYGFCGVCLFALFDPFITIWIGKEYVMNIATESLIILDLLVVGLQETVGTHCAAYGLFYRCRYRPIFSVSLNIIFSVIFVKFMPVKYGVVAVLLGTVLSNLFSTFWYTARVLHKEAFNRSATSFYLRFAYRMLYCIVMCIAFKWITSILPLQGVSLVVVSLLLCIVIYNLIFILVFHKSPELKYAKDAILSLTKIRRKG